MSVLFSSVKFDVIFSGICFCQISKPIILFSMLPLSYALLSVDFFSFFCGLPKPIFPTPSAGALEGDMEVIDSTTVTCMSIGGMRALFIHTVLSLSSCVWLVVARTCLCN